MLQQAHGEDCLSGKQCHEWYQHFKLGRTSKEDNPESGQSSTSMDNDHIEKALAVIHQNHRLTVCEVAKRVGVCKSLCHLILTKKLKMRCVAANLCQVCWRVTPYPWIFDKAQDDCCPPAAPLSRFRPCRLFLLPKVEILAKRPLISNSRRDRRKFDMGPLRCPAKYVPGRVPEMEKMLGVVYQEWKGVLWSCK